ncbi:MAG: glucose PTS transporter subunit EIIB [Trueperella pyogenes]|nr:glucose PTS transporter subunit EIIB [Trueperella pyogenes]MCI7690089.1 glucose PTS transporter subunit EIIB [Trueperella pyogenes]
MNIDDLLSALGGQANIRKVDNALARIRVGVVDRSIVDKAALKKAGALGVVVQKRAVQLILGEEAESIGMALYRRVFGANMAEVEG